MGIFGTSHSLGARNGKRTCSLFISTLCPLLRSDWLGPTYRWKDRAIVQYIWVLERKEEAHALNTAKLLLEGIPIPGRPALPSRGESVNNQWLDGGPPVINHKHEKESCKIPRKPQNSLPSTTLPYAITAKFCSTLLSVLIVTYRQ